MSPSPSRLFVLYVITFISALFALSVTTFWDEATPTLRLCLGGVIIVAILSHSLCAMRMGLLEGRGEPAPIEALCGGEWRVEVIVDTTTSGVATMLVVSRTDATSRKLVRMLVSAKPVQSGPFKPGDSVRVGKASPYVGPVLENA